MSKEAMLYGAFGLIVGAAVSGLITYGVSNKNTNPVADTPMTMTDMVDSLKGKSGDDFDKAFISGMMEHHQGAINMAKLAKDNAKHNEIRKMADDIISAQSKEIHMMTDWQGDWGYKSHDMRH